MKNLFLTLSLIFTFHALLAQNTTPTIGQVFNTIADLKLQKGSPNTVVYVTGGSTTTDFRGAFYKWDSASTDTEDMVNYNVIQVTGVNTGRWIRTNQSATTLPQGTLFRIGPIKILAANGITNSSGEFVLNLTTDNTSGGTAIFSNILFNSTMATTAAASPNDAVTGSVKTVSTGNKVCTYRYTKGNSLGVGVLVSLTQAGTSVPVQCFVLGI